MAAAGRRAAGPAHQTVARSDRAVRAPEATVRATAGAAAPPRIWLPLPANGATYTLGQVVHSYFLCADGSGGPGLKSCADQNGQPAGAAIDTSTLGTHSFTVTATSQDGQVSSTSAAYRVVPPPTVS